MPPIHHVIILAGPSGVGKTTQGDILCTRNSFEFLSVGREARAAYPPVVTPGHLKVTGWKQRKEQERLKKQTQEEFNRRIREEREFKAKRNAQVSSEWRDLGGVVVLDGWQVDTEACFLSDTFTQKNVLLIEMSASDKALESRRSSREEFRHERRYSAPTHAKYNPLSTILTTTGKSVSDVALCIQSIVDLFLSSAIRQDIVDTLFKSIECHYLIPSLLPNFSSCKSIQNLEGTFDSGFEFNPGVGDFFLQKRIHGSSFIFVSIPDHGACVYNESSQLEVPSGLGFTVVASGILHFDCNVQSFEFLIYDIIFIESREVWGLDFEKRIELANSFIKSPTEVTSSFTIKVAPYCSFAYNPAAVLGLHNRDNLLVIPHGPSLISFGLVFSTTMFDLERLEENGQSSEENVENTLSKLTVSSKEVRIPAPCPLLDINYPDLSESIEILIKDGLLEYGNYKQFKILSYTSIGSRSPDATVFRGLIIDCAKEKIVSLPMPRFPATTAPISEIPNLKNSVCTIKIDGSLILAVKYDGELLVATKRRFDSEQALFAKEWMERHKTVVNGMKEGFTYHFELIGEDNIHVVEYPVSGLILLVVTDACGVSLSREELETVGQELDVIVVPIFSTVPIVHTSLSKYIDESGSDFFSSNEGGTRILQEGWVIQNGHSDKIKSINWNWTAAGKETRKLNPERIWNFCRQRAIDSSSLHSQLQLTPHHLQYYNKVRTHLDVLFKESCLEKNAIDKGKVVAFNSNYCLFPQHTERTFKLAM
ncbi:hypothetical protein BDR26DRAFT_1011066 [Obelidium mucronatum]|nr:hypothetical protein BDR26DRAFT_1011066 [Obelidium mucronatum]